MDKLNYLRGDDLILDSGIKFTHPRIEDLMDNRVNQFHSLVNLFTTRSIDNIGMLYVEAGVENPLLYDDYNLFLSLFLSSKDYFNNAFSIECEIDDFNVVNTEEYGYILLSTSTRKFLTREDYFLIKKFYLDIMHIKKDDIYKDIKGKFAIKMIIDNEVEKYQRQKNRKQNIEQTEKEDKNTNILSNQIGALVAITNYGINYENIFKLKIYQFYDMLKNYNNQINYRNVMNGLYSQGIDTKKINIGKINWIIQ
jgi:hypothetical protein